MTWLRVALSRIGGLFRGRRLEQRLQEELGSHLEMLIETRMRVAE